MISCTLHDGDCSDSCGCGGGISDTSFDIQSIVIENRSFVVLSDENWIPVETDPINSDETVNALNYLIELRAVADPPYYATIKNSGHGILDFLFGKPAMACSPAPPYTNEIISQLTITSDSDFSTSYPAGSSLNTLFAVQYTSAYQDYNYVSGQNVDEYVDLNPHGALRIQFVLTEVPALAKEHIFKIEYVHEGGEYFEAYTERVRFE